MGKKDGKKVDKAKVEAKKARQAAKQQKVTVKRTKKEVKDQGEEDIETILAEFAAKDAKRIAVNVSICSQPSPRSNFSFTLLPSTGERLLFGGEFCDGETTVVYNDLFKWNVEKNEWKQIESLNTPPPRCSHQAVYYKDKVYVFGGEYATLDQFHHYRDMWELDLKTLVWQEIKTVGDAPTARSGHRMLVWRNFIVLFGGFYEAMREIKWYNDLYLYAFQDNRWVHVQYKQLGNVPKPRSGFQMFLSNQEDSIFIYGGFSKEKILSSDKNQNNHHVKKEGRVHEDMWLMNLKPLLNSVSSGTTTTSKGSIDISKAVWQKISRKGDFPSARCGASIAMYKNKILLFGGVFDEEGPRHSLISQFYNDLYAFDMERRRWYKLGLKQKQMKKSNESKKIEKQNRKLLKESREKDKGGEGVDEIEEGEVSEEEEDDDEDDGAVYTTTKPNVTDELNRPGKEYFGYIDENGLVVYLDMSEMEDEVDPPDAAMTKLEAEGVSMKLTTTSELISKDGLELNPQPATSISSSLTPPVGITLEAVPSSIVNEVDNVREIERRKNLEKYAKHLIVQSKQPDTEPIDRPDGEPVVPDESENLSKVARFFQGQSQPSSRINAALITRGNALYVYGGMTELGDVEVTLDDCWVLDVNKRDQWKQILAGTMHLLVWKGADDEDEEESSSRRTGQSDDEEDEDDDDEGEDEDGEGEGESGGKRREKSEKLVDPPNVVKKLDRSKKTQAIGLRAEIDSLRSHFDVTDKNRTPLAGESLRDFYSRTTEYWSNAVVERWNEEQSLKGADVKINKSEILTEKEIKRNGFIMAEKRYNELLPILSRLNELEIQQRDEEENQHNGQNNRLSGYRKLK